MFRVIPGKINFQKIRNVQLCHFFLDMLRNLSSVLYFSTMTSFLYSEYFPSKTAMNEVFCIHDDFLVFIYIFAKP